MLDGTQTKDSLIQPTSTQVSRPCLTRLVSLRTSSRIRRLPSSFTTSLTNMAALRQSSRSSPSHQYRLQYPLVAMATCLHHLHHLQGMLHHPHHPLDGQPDRPLHPHLPAPLHPQEVWGFHHPHLHLTEQDPHPYPHRYHPALRLRPLSWPHPLLHHHLGGHPRHRRPHHQDPHHPQWLPHQLLPHCQLLLLLVAWVRLVGGQLFWRRYNMARHFTISRRRSVRAQRHLMNVVVFLLLSVRVSPCSRLIQASRESLTRWRGREALQVLWPVPLPAGPRKCKEILMKKKMKRMLKMMMTGMTKRIRTSSYVVHVLEEAKQQLTTI